ncbi:efflux RND transporter permease subunit, partial [bacterium]|nr:efflux RND transporter permease subunit [bacterium]
DEDIKKIQNWADENFANAEIIARKVPLGPPYNAPVEVRILGDDIQKLMKFRDIGKEELRKIKNVILVNDDWGEKISNIKIKVEKANILRRGLNVQTLSNSINASTKGFNVSNFIDNNNDNVSINIRLNEGIRQNSENLKTIQIYSEKLKNTIPLSEIASLEVNYDYPEIIRRNGQYSITIEGYINKNKTTSKKVVEKLMKKLKKLELPAGYRFEVGGIVENSNKGMKAVMAEMPLVIGLCGIILISYFNSIKNTLIIVLTGILALSGANLGLFITHSYFGFMTFLGYISLLGMACNNSVVLIDYFEENLKDKIKTKNKIILLTLKRIRPISLTALTTIAGMLPLWLLNDPMFSSMAIAIIFGLITSILSTIILAPTLYLVFNKIK